VLEAARRRLLTRHPGDATVGLVQPGDEREQRGLAGSAAADDPEPLVRLDVQIDPVQHRLAAQDADDACQRDRAGGEGPALCDCFHCPPFAGMTRIRFDGYALGSALSAPRQGLPGSARF
jgi:hypothetical protein